MKKLICLLLAVFTLALSGCYEDPLNNRDTQTSTTLSGPTDEKSTEREITKDTKAKTGSESSKPSSESTETTANINTKYTVTFSYEGNTKTYTLKAGESLTIPTPSNTKLKYVWDTSVPSVMPSKNVKYTATAIKGSFWTLDTNGVFTVSTSMSDLSEYAAYKSKIISVVISGNCPKICQFAFESCRSLKKVDIGNSVTKIEMAAFTDCPALTSITLGKNVSRLEAWALNAENLSNLIVKGKKNWSASYQTSPNSSMGQSITFSDSAPSNASKYNQYSEYTWTAS